ncbi:uncharacterized protein K460DRAFT_208389 [Cucurbitaria berberidis CBS 394.84]|uniref:Uncharacterized protein n=1 Tax=Cucurbitaria berberidis CBS 394.84 TaxID=1168544 RepID=A0A9P4G7N3_9PLEO|nr:uncharacterized protein K460DRAFT_208389 [Cucurbitaria berberidis CBS 394.84]KAF1840431.1 hypothetical protein K460DRAFT_208389 [Cucurbitaria berberidis CBS 394.84]
MIREDFDNLVASIWEGLELDSSIKSKDKLEAVLADRLQRDTEHLKSLLEDSKREVFLDANIPAEVDELLPCIQQPSWHGCLRFIIQTLPQLSSAKQATILQSPQVASVSPPASIAFKRRLASTPPSAVSQPRSSTHVTRVQKRRKKQVTKSVQQSEQIKIRSNNKRQ